MTPSKTNLTAGQARPGQIVRSHSNHPTEWMMLTRAIGGVRFRGLNNGREGDVVTLPHLTTLYSEENDRAEIEEYFAGYPAWGHSTGCDIHPCTCKAL